MNLWNWQRLEAWLTLNARKSTRRRTPRNLPAQAEMLESRALLSTLTVTTLDDTNVDGDGQLSLREAITIANSNSAGVTIDGVSSGDVNDSIVFSTGLNGTISLTGGQLSISAPVSISGGSNITIDAQQDSRILDLTAAAGTVALDGLTLVNGQAATGSGGAIQAAAGTTLNISNSTLSGNSTLGAAGNGGAISSAGSLNIIGSTLTGNSTVGANSDGGAIAATGTLAVVNSTLTGNFTTAADADGGAIYSTGATVSLVNATIDLNDAGGIGGGINASGVATINNTIIAQNSAGSSADLEIVEATTTLNNSLIGSNAGTTLTAAAVGLPDANGNLIGTAAVTIDPGLGALADNGGSVQTQALLSTSVARDAGDIAFALDLLGVTLTTDARGTGFLRTDGIADIGAFEVQAGINLGPVNIVPAAQSIITGTNLTFSVDAGTRLAIRDPDAGGKPVEVTLTATNGTVTLSQVTGLTFTTGDGAADAALTFSGTVADINAALDGAVFSPTAAFTGAASLQIATSDLGNTGSGGTLTDSDTLAITVAAAGANLTPVITAPSATLSATIGTALNFDASTGTISISDNDNSGTDLSVTLTATHGTLTLGSTAGLAFTVGDGTADATITFTGSLADINAALATLSFTSSGSFQGPATVVVDVDDQFGDATATASQTINLTVAAANLAPVNNLPVAQTVTVGSTLNFTAGSGNLISISDADAGDTPIQVTLTATNGTFTLGTLAGLTFSAGDGTTDTTATFTGTLADINTALESLSFTAAAAGAATLQIDTNDQGSTGTGGSLTDSDILSINALAVNVGPINTVPVVTLNATAGAALVFSTANGNLISIADADAGVNPVEVSLTAVNGTLTLSGVAGLTFTNGDGTADAQMTFRGTLADINSALAGASFTANAGFSGAASVIVATNDLGNTGGGGAKTDVDVVSINVAAAVANVAPVNTVPTVTVNATTGVAVVFSTANGNLISIADADAGANPVQVTLTAVNGTLSLSGVAGLTFTAGDGTADAQMTFTGTIAAINAALAGASFTSNPGFTGAAAVVVTTSDLGNTGSGGAQTDTDVIAVNVAASGAVNVAPVNTIPTVTVNATTGVAIVFSTANGNLISIADADAGANPVQVTLTAVNGTLSLSAVAGLTFTAGDGTADAQMTFTGTIAAINAALAGASFTSTAGFVGNAALIVTTNDLGNTGSGGPQTDTDVVTIAVAAAGSANLPPVNTLPGTQTVAAGGTITFRTAIQRDLSGPWVINGQATSISLDGSNAVFTNEFRASARGRVVSGSQVVADEWGGLVGTVSSDGNSISWSNGTLWSRPASPSVNTSISIADPDAGTSPVSVTLTSVGGTVTLSQTTGLTFTAGDGTADAAMTFTGTLANINAALQGSTYTANAGFSGEGSLTIVTNDLASGGALSDTDTLRINVVSRSNSSLEGAWSINGQGTSIAVLGNSGNVRFTNEFGDTASGRIISSTQVIADGWGGLVGTVSADGNTINWANNTTWVRAQVSPPSFTPPTLAMNWSINGNQSTQITTNSPFSLTFRNEFGDTSAGTFTSPTQVVATGWGNLVGNLNANGTEIQWANNTRWTTSTPAIQPSSLDSAFADPLMTSMV